MQMFCNFLQQNGEPLLFSVIFFDVINSQENPMFKKALVLSAVSLSLMSATALAQNLAVVNGKPIPASHSDALVKELVSYGEKDTPQLRQDVKNKLVLREVLVQEAEKQNVASTNEVRKQLEFARRSILIDALRSIYLKKNPVSDKEVKAEYDRVAAQQNGKQYHVKHILVKTEAEAQNIINQINKGASFEKLAKEKSIDQSSAVNGGDLSWASPSNYIKPFSDAMVALPKDQTSKTPVKTQFGYHILKVVDVRKATMPTLDQVKPKIKAALEEKKWQEYEMGLMRQAKVE